MSMVEVKWNPSDKELRQFGWLKVAQGVTTVEEVMRVTTADDEGGFD